MQIFDRMTKSKGLIIQNNVLDNLRSTDQTVTQLAPSMVQKYEKEFKITYKNDLECEENCYTFSGLTPLQQTSVPPYTGYVMS